MEVFLWRTSTHHPQSTRSEASARDHPFTVVSSRCNSSERWRGPGSRPRWVSLPYASKCNHCYTYDVTNDESEASGVVRAGLQAAFGAEPLPGERWRKLKAAGAVYLQNGVAALPDIRRGADDARRGARDPEVGGTAHLLRVLRWAIGELEKIFDEARDAEYAEVLGRCRDSTPSWTRSVVLAISPSPS